MAFSVSQIYNAWVDKMRDKVSHESTLQQDSVSSIRHDERLMSLCREYLEAMEPVKQALLSDEVDMSAVRNALQIMQDNIGEPVQKVQSALKTAGYDWSIDDAKMLARKEGVTIGSMGAMRDGIEDGSVAAGMMFVASSTMSSGNWSMAQDEISDFAKKAKQSMESNTREIADKQLAEVLSANPVLNDMLSNDRPIDDVTLKV